MPPTPDISNFQKDLDDPSAGTSSDLYSAVKPMIDTGDTSGYKAYDADRIQRLHNDVRKGLVGLEYMTGLKHNTGKTFYDEHPVQAVGTDVLKNSVPIGMGVAGLGTLHNYLRQMKNFGKTAPGQLSADGKRTDRSNAATMLEESEKNPLREDLSRLFGEGKARPGNRKALLDRMHVYDQLDHSGQGNFAGGLQTITDKMDRHQKNFGRAEKHLEDSLDRTYADKGLGTPDEQRETQKRIDTLERRKKFHTAGKTPKEKALSLSQNEFLQNAGRSEAAAGLPTYARLHENYRKLEANNDKLKPYTGSGLHKHAPKKGLGKDIMDAIVPNAGQEHLDEIERVGLTGQNRHYSESMLQKILHEHGHLDQNNPDGKGRSMIEGLQRLGRQTSETSGLQKFWNRSKLPLAAGAATAVGGTGLYHLIKAIQNQTLNKDKVRDWKKTTLKYRGEFDEADKVK